MPKVTKNEYLAANVGLMDVTSLCSDGIEREKMDALMRDLFYVEAAMLCDHYENETCSFDGGLICDLGRPVVRYCSPVNCPLPGHVRKDNDKT